MGLVTLPGLKELNLLGVKDLYHSLCFDSTLNLHQQYCTWVFYDNIKQFTNKRIDDLNLATNNNFLELENFPILPLEIVKYDTDGNVLDFEHYERVKNHYKLIEIG